MALDKIERSAMCIVMSEYDGNEFDWKAMRFKEDK